MSLHFAEFARFKSLNFLYVTITHVLKILSFINLILHVCDVFSWIAVHDIYVHSRHIVNITKFHKNFVRTNAKNLLLQQNWKTRNKSCCQGVMYSTSIAFSTWIHCIHICVQLSWPLLRYVTWPHELRVWLTWEVGNCGSNGIFMHPILISKHKQEWISSRRTTDITSRNVLSDFWVLEHSQC